MVTTEIDDLHKTVVVRRRHLRRLLNTLTARPWRVMAIDCARRGDLEARYAPQSATKNGALVREGDYSPIDDTDCRAGTHVFGAGRKYPITQARRTGDRVVIQPAGTLRTVMVKNWDHDNPRPTKHWTPQGKTLHYDPAKHDLFLLQGFYNDQVKEQPGGWRVLGRYGQWRPFCNVCLRTTTQIRAQGRRYVVVE